MELRSSTAQFRLPRADRGATSPMFTQPSVRSLLDALPTKARLFEVARHFGVTVPSKGTKAELAASLAQSDQLRLRHIRGHGARRARPLGFALTRRTAANYGFSP